LFTKRKDHLQNQPEQKSMNPIVKTATIPHLNSFRNLLPPGNASTDVLTATEEQLAQMSEATLDRLSDRVHRIGSPVAELQVPTNEPKTKLAAPSKIASDAIQNVVNQIAERSNSAVPMILLFAGSEPNEHVDEMSARIAAALCDTMDSRVLLIDSDNVGKNLTTASRRLEESGMTEVIEYNRDWRVNLLRNQSSNLDFLPVGNGSFGRWNQKELLRKAACEMKTEYQYICVAVGDAHSKAAKLWSDVCDGSYLLVSIKNSNGTIAKSAVTELKTNGARLLGCIATDA
jgi:Mrp family chromosome partitioning ATPase